MKDKEFDFKEKLQSMTIKNIVLMVIDAVENPVVTLNFDTFGKVINGVCCGCAATNSLCKMSAKVFDNNSIEKRAAFIDIKNMTLVSAFESSIDDLRNIDFYWYNYLADKYNYAQLPINLKHNLVVLNNESIKDPATLIAWKAFAEKL